MADISLKQIMLWADSSIPENWQICDGTNGTPDLRSKFVYGASVNADLGTTGGADAHTHSSPASSSAGSSHTHSFSVTTSTPGGSSRLAASSKYSYGGHNHSYSGTTTSGNSTHTHGSSLASSNSVPPCILVYYIMKVA